MPVLLLHEFCYTILCNASDLNPNHNTMGYTIIPTSAPVLLPLVPAQYNNNTGTPYNSYTSTASILSRALRSPTLIIFTLILIYIHPYHNHPNLSLTSIPTNLFLS